MAIINSIGLLRQDLIAHGWHMTAFLFNYNRHEYDVLFENNGNIDTRHNPYASVILHFIDIHNPSRTYSVEANQKRIFFCPREFREYFDIQFSQNLGDVFRQFYNYFLGFVPDQVPTNLNARQNYEIDRQLAHRGQRDPNAIYCYDARRLGKRNDRQMVRSIFISNLTQRRKPALYEHFKNEPTVTFYYSPKPEEERSDDEIIDLFTRRENERNQA